MKREIIICSATNLVALHDYIVRQTMFLSLYFCISELVSDLIFLAGRLSYAAATLI
uniref:Uncharacterized protein n=1 Tax=Kuenenia stuttgartiensis TaxID=174633 RepID=Q1PYV9_KUEST|nr:unknown protein [Candidatus Kuenenia stuttgartiensis]